MFKACLLTAMVLASLPAYSATPTEPAWMSQVRAELGPRWDGSSVGMFTAVLRANPYRGGLAELKSIHGYAAPPPTSVVANLFNKAAEQVITQAQQSYERGALFRHVVAGLPVGWEQLPLGEAATVMSNAVQRTRSSQFRAGSIHACDLRPTYATCSSPAGEYHFVYGRGKPNQVITTGGQSIGAEMVLGGSGTEAGAKAWWPANPADFVYWEGE